MQFDRRIVVGLLLLLVSVLALSWLPVNQTTLITEGIDNYQFHRPLFGTVTQSQTVRLTEALHGVGGIIVGLKKNAPLHDVKVAIRTSAGTTLAQVTIPAQAIQDDIAATQLLSRPIPATSEPVFITFAAPDATKDNPMAIRFHPDDVYADGTRFGTAAELGDLAVALVQPVPAWRFVFTTITQQPQQARLVVALVSALLLTLLSFRWGWRNRPLRHQHIIETTSIVVIILVALLLRLTTITQLGGVSGGDPYNYLSITKNLATLHNPFEADKRLPLYPLLLLPGYLTKIDDQWWMRFLSSVAGAACVGLIMLLARRLRLPWSVQLLTAVILAFHKDFFWTSLRPEPYTIYTAWLLLALILFFQLKKRWAQISFGVVLGLAAMTRQEGFMLAIVLGGCALLWWRELLEIPRPAPLWWRYLIPTKPELIQVIKNYTWAFLPALLFVLPFFLNNAILYGNPLYTPYFKGEKLQIVDSWPAFKESAGATWGVMSAMWWQHWDELYRVPLTHPLFIAGALIALLWSGVQYIRQEKLRSGIAIASGIGWFALIILMVANLTQQSGGFGAAVMIITSGILVVSSIPFLLATSWRGVIVLCVGITQLGIALWFHPFPKHFQQVYPLLMLLFVTALIAAKNNGALPTASNRWQVIARALNRVAVLMPLLFILLTLYASVNGAIDRQNEGTAFDSVVYRAVQVMREQPAPYGFDQSYLPAHIYLGDDARYYAGDEDNYSPKDEQAWVNLNGINTMLVTNINKAFDVPPPNWQLLSHFKAAGKHDEVFESWVYHVPPAQN